MKKSKFEINTKTMAYMAIFAALQIVLEYLTQFTPQMPRGGNVAFSLVALMLCSYLMGPIYGLVVSLVCVGLHFVLGLATFYGALSVIFDYLLPMAIVGSGWKRMERYIRGKFFTLVDTGCRLVNERKYISLRGVKRLYFKYGDLRYRLVERC